MRNRETLIGVCVTCIISDLKLGYSNYNKNYNYMNSNNIKCKHTSSWGTNNIEKIKQ